jgi:hypothetical protein
MERLLHGHSISARPHSVRFRSVRVGQSRLVPAVDLATHKGMGMGHLESGAATGRGSFVGVTPFKFDRNDRSPAMRESG